MLSEQGEAGQVPIAARIPRRSGRILRRRRGVCGTVMGPMRIAWFSPLPPDQSGIAAYCAELLPLLARSHAIEAFVDDGGGRAAVGRVRPIPGVRVHGAHDFPWRQALQPFDAIVYQLGNQLCHNYMWPYMVRWPGVVVLHDGQVHHARAAGLIDQGRGRDYRAEFAYSHPGAPRELHEFVISGWGAMLPSLFFEHPMVRVPVESARIAAVHNPLLAGELQEMVPGAAVTAIRQGVRDLTAGVAPPSALRARLGIPPGAVVFAAYGRATPEKRLTPVMKAMGQLAAPGTGPQPWLVCVGATADYYDVRQEAAAAGLSDRFVITGYVDDADLGAYLALADACLCLRWPSGRETSASWLRCLAAGKPTIISGLAHLTGVPAIDPRSMQAVPLGNVPADARDPLAMLVELTDEIHMLKRALRHLTEQAPLRARMGRAARAWWAAHATVDLMAEDYEALLERARTAPPNPHPAWPAHLVADGAERARAIAGQMGVTLDW